MKKNQSIVFKTVGDYRSILPGLIVGLVFLSEGIRKFLFPELVGVGKGTNRVWLSFPESFSLVRSFGGAIERTL